MEWGTVPARFLIHHNLHDFQAIGTSMFLHSSVLHLLGNMWILFLFGDNVEERLGHCTYLAFYVCCGLFADLLHIVSDPTSIIPAVGASGAIAGVMGAYIAMHPDAKCKTWWGDDWFFLAFKTYQVPAVFIASMWLALQFLIGALVPALPVWQCGRTSAGFSRASDC
jgi:membrane associated rhomboid family serine protease